MIAKGKTHYSGSSLFLRINPIRRLRILTGQSSQAVEKVCFGVEIVIPAKAGIQCFKYLLDPPVKPEDDKY